METKNLRNKKTSRISKFIRIAGYELIPLNEEHSHFICEKCGKIIDVKLSGDLKQTYDENGNFYLRKHVTYYGICKDCLKTK